MNVQFKNIKAQNLLVLYQGSLDCLINTNAGLPEDPAISLTEEFTRYSEGQMWINVLQLVTS